MYLDLNTVIFQYIDGFGCYQIGIGIDYFILNFFTTSGSGLGLQVTVLIRVSQIHWAYLWCLFKC